MPALAERALRGPVRARYAIACEAGGRARAEILADRQLMQQVAAAPPGRLAAMRAGVGHITDTAGAGSPQAGAAQATPAQLAAAGKLGQAESAYLQTPGPQGGILAQPGIASPGREASRRALALEGASGRAAVAPAAFLGPPRYLGGVGAGLDAQPRGAQVAGLAVLAVMEPGGNPAHWARRSPLPRARAAISVTAAAWAAPSGGRRACRQAAAMTCAARASSGSFPVIGTP